MSAKQLKRLRTFVIVVLVLLVVQYEFGMAVNISNPPSLPAFSMLDGNAFNQALSSAGFVAEAHSIVGFLIWLLALAVLVMALRSGIRSVQIFGTLILLTVTVAGISGDHSWGTGTSRQPCRPNKWQT